MDDANDGYFETHPSRFKVVIFPKDVMIRDSKLIDKLIADLHFHNYLFVVEGDNMFTEHDEHIESIQSLLKSLGLDNQLDAHTDFYHGGNVLTKEKTDYLNKFIDDVFIDYFFRTYQFKEIIFPKGLCYEQMTPNGIIHPDNDISLNLNNIYDRCTFANNIFRLFGIDNDLLNLFPNNRYIKSFSINDRIYGLHSWCGVLINDKPIYSAPLDSFLDKYYPGYSLERTNRRGRTIKEFVKYLFNYDECNHDYYNSFSTTYLLTLHKFEDGFKEIKDSNIFGEYTIKEILLIYSLLIDKFLLDENSFLLSLCQCYKTEILENEFLNDFIHFEENHLECKNIEPFIRSKDMYLRFASHTKSKAFSFEQINEVLWRINLFNKPSVTLIRHSNTMPLPYLYNSFTKS